MRLEEGRSDMEPLHAVQTGVVVESVTVGSRGEQAGIQAGDLLRFYQALPIISPWVCLALQENTVGYTSIALLLQRKSMDLTLAVPCGPLGVEVRPELSSEALRLYEALRIQSLETLIPSLEQQI